MKVLKKLGIESLEDKMPEIEKMIEVLVAESNSSDSRYECVPQCASYVFGQFGKTGNAYSSETLQNEIDFVYSYYGKPTGQGVLSNDFIPFMGVWFEGGAVTITMDYVMESGTYVTAVVAGHAVQVMNVQGEFALCLDVQNNCTSVYHISQIQMAYKSTGVNEHPSVSGHTVLAGLENTAG